MESALVAINVSCLGGFAFALYLLQQHLVKRVEAAAEKIGTIEAELSKLDDVVKIQASIHAAKEEISLEIKRTLEEESLSRERDSRRLEKLERAYMLCQPLYIGHKRELEKVRLADVNTTQAKWLENREHPGDPMNEIKMIVSMYAPNLEQPLKLMNGGHRKLKDRLHRIDLSFSDGTSGDHFNESTINELDAFMEELQRGVHQFKKGTVELVQTLNSLGKGS